MFESGLPPDINADLRAASDRAFGVLNSFFIVVLAPMFSKMWEKHWNPSGPVKFGVGLVLQGVVVGVMRRY